MTIGGAISDLNNLLKADDIPIYYKPSIKKIIETIEQEPILDKIRADIEEMKIEDNSNNICFKIHNNVVEGVLRIIDKCRAESEG